MHEVMQQGRHELGLKPLHVKLQEPTKSINNMMLENYSSSDESVGCDNGLTMRSYHVFVKGDQRTESISGSQSITKSEGDRSECTNPYLEMLLDRYFPSDDEDVGCEADGEYDADLFTNSSTRASPTRKSPLGKRSSSSRRRTTFSSLGRSRKDDIFGNCNLYYRDNKNEFDINLEEDIGKHHSPRYNKNTEEWFQEAQRHYLLGEVNRLKDANLDTNVDTNMNMWDSSPSTVEGGDFIETKGPLTPDHSALKCYLDEEFKYSDSFHKNPTDNNDIRKALFAPIIEDELTGVSSMRDNFEEKYDLDTDNDDDDDDDLDLIYRARKIQHDLRLQEMEELAVEAERAAAEGKEKFVGNATKFGLDDTLSIITEINSPYQDADDIDRNLSCSGHLPSDLDESNHKRVTLAPSPMTNNGYYPKGRIIPKTEIKRPRSLRLQDRFASAPSKLQLRDNSPTIIPSLSNTVPSILTAKSFLSLAQSKVAENKVPVLSLRHIEEVIPSFGEMHLFVESHMLRAGVKKEMLHAPDEIEDENLKLLKQKKGTVDEKGSATESRTSSNSKFPRIPSFHKLFQSFSGLSVDDSAQNNSTNEVVDSDVEIGSSSEVEGESGHCASNHGFTEDLGVSAIAHQKEKQNHTQRNDMVVKSSSELSDIYVCTLASEINSPNRRPRSPPVEPPYGKMEEHMMEVLEREMNPSTNVDSDCPPQSRWTSFWANISPRRDPISHRRARSLTLESDHEFRSVVSRQLYRYNSQTSLEQTIYAHSDTFGPRVSKYSSIRRMEATPSSSPEEIESNTRQNDGACQPSSSNCLLDTETRKQKSTKSLRITATQPTSYETESSGSAFSQYSKLSNPNDVSRHTRRISSMTLDRDSAASPKPPLHPAGIRLANVLLTNAGIKRETEKMDSTGKLQERSHHNSQDEATFTKNESKPDDFSNDGLGTLSQNNYNQQTIRVKAGAEECVVEVKKVHSFSSVTRFCMGEETSLCGEETSLPGSLHNNINKLAEHDDDESSSLMVDDNNKSSSSFMHLLENVKVPLVLDRFSPLLRKKEPQDHKPTYQDAAAFVGNYFYVGVSSEDDNSGQGNDTICSDEKRRFCSRTPCIESSCGDFSSSFLGNALRLLSQKSSWEKESGPLLNEPETYNQQQWLRNALCQCAGRQNYQRREEVIIGNRRFRAPNLQIQKGGFFSRRSEGTLEEKFKLGQRSTSSVRHNCAGIDVGFVDDSYNNILTQNRSSKASNRRHKKYQDKIKRAQKSCNSLLTCSDQSDTDE